MPLHTTGQPDSVKKGRGKKRWFYVPAEEKDSLRSEGYSPLEPQAARRKALAKAVKEYGATETFRKLMSVSNVTKRSQPENSRIYHSDARWVSETYIPKPALKTNEHPLPPSLRKKKR